MRFGKVSRKKFENLRYFSRNGRKGGVARGSMRKTAPQMYRHIRERPPATADRRPDTILYRRPARINGDAGKDQYGENAAACLSRVSCDALHGSSSIKVVGDKTIGSITIHFGMGINSKDCDLPSLCGLVRNACSENHKGYEAGEKPVF
jgi:hypothetical protein